MTWDISHPHRMLGAEWFCLRLLLTPSITPRSCSRCFSKTRAGLPVRRFHTSASPTLLTHGGLHFLKSQLGTGAQLLELCPGTHPIPNFLVRSGTELLGGLLPARSHALPLCFPSHSLHLLQDLTQTHSWPWSYPINTRTAGSAFCSGSSHMVHSPEFQNLKGLTCCLI